ncbi:DEAD-box ATP-dependent RNA helicase 16-like [Dorcoceras hygrometricum]|uniref:DEAD-box ATP-dependent RNA helicase 16-like n=1 Tax=Dorcoceras hygrometricum TaxID=472368 RepID=A0A2Z7CAZ0_9LAMI|nr:DEAD-box ATP-dependent RNA helicase 16-like [Dorcoceras hygrometricum]
MQYFQRAMHEGYQESSVGKAQRLSCAESNFVIFRNLRSVSHHSVVVFRHDYSAGHHINISVGPFRHDGSTDRSQRTKEISSQEDQAQYLFQIYRALSNSKSKLKSIKNHLLKAAKERKNYLPEFAKISNSAATSCTLNSSTQVSKLVSIERSHEDELSTTNIAPNDGVNRRQSTGKGQRYSENLSLKSKLIPAWTLYNVPAQAHNQLRHYKGWDRYTVPAEVLICKNQIALQSNPRGASSTPLSWIQLALTQGSPQLVASNNELAPNYNQHGVILSDQLSSSLNLKQLISTSLAQNAVPERPQAGIFTSSIPS